MICYSIHILQLLYIYTTTIHYNYYYTLQLLHLHHTLTTNATLAISLIAPSVKSNCTFSDRISSTCCLMRLLTGSVRMRYISSSVNPFRVTRIGRRPWSSASRSDGLAVLRISTIVVVLVYITYNK